MFEHNEPFVVVLTGGPCGGKSTFLAKARDYLQNRGFRVVIISEVATELISAGIVPWADWKDGLVTFQKFLLSYSLFRENSYREVAEKMLGDGRVVILCDRGALDPMAYIGRNEFLKVTEHCHQTLSSLMARYDLVIHLVTAANGAEEFYTLANNEARTETPERARELDSLVRDAWMGHEHISVIDNSTNFNEKIGRALTSLTRGLGMPAPLEIERKFFVRNFKNIQIPENAVEAEIVQTYLSSSNPNVERRVRAKTISGVATYTYTEKSPTGRTGEREEKERMIQRSEYERLLREQDPKTFTIRKVRYNFPVGMSRFELDIYREALQGLVVLEVEVSSMDEEILIPDDWDVVEVTDKPEWSNHALARSLRLNP